MPETKVSRLLSKKTGLDWEPEHRRAAPAGDMVRYYYICLVEDAMGWESVWSEVWREGNRWHGFREWRARDDGVDDSAHVGPFSTAVEAAIALPMLPQE